MLDLLKTALLRLAIYVAPVLFGLAGALVTKLGFGVYDQAAGTITISLAAFQAAIGLMIVSGLTAATALLKGWKSRRSQ